jgi:hypothetical protein
VRIARAPRHPLSSVRSAWRKGCDWGWGGARADPQVLAQLDANFAHLAGRRHTLCVARSLRKDQIPVLLALSGGSMTENQIAERLSRRRSSVSRSLAPLARDQLVASVGNGAGALTESKWELTALGRQHAEPGSDGGADQAPAPTSPDPSNTRPRPGAASRPSHVREKPRAPGLNAHQAFVATRLTSREVPDLLEVLATAELSAASAAIARLDGEEHNYLFLFDAAAGPAPAEQLSSVLRRRDIKFTLGTVADVRSLAEMLRDARRASTD